MKTTFKAGNDRWIPLKELEPHPQAQRKLDPRHAAAIAESFDPALMGVLTVAETKRGRRWIVDGQHRKVAALQFVDGDGDQCVKCNVIDVDDDAEAARLFLGLNKHKTVLTLDKFMVRVTAKDSTACGIVGVLAKHSLHIDRTRCAGVVQAVDALESVFQRPRGALLLERTVRILNNAWGADPDAYSGQLVRGLGLLLRKFGTAVDDEELIRKLAKSGGPLNLIGRARALRAAMGVSVAQATYECIRNEYNKGRRTEKLEERAA